MTHPVITTLRDYEKLMLLQVPVTDALLELFPDLAPLSSFLLAGDDDTIWYKLDFLDDEGQRIGLDITVPLKLALCENEFDIEVLVGWVKAHPECIDDALGHYLVGDEDDSEYPWQA